MHRRPGAPSLIASACRTRWATTQDHGQPCGRPGRARRWQPRPFHLSWPRVPGAAGKRMQPGIRGGGSRHRSHHLASRPACVCRRHAHLRPSRHQRSRSLPERMSSGEPAANGCSTCAPAGGRASRGGTPILHLYDRPPRDAPAQPRDPVSQRGRGCLTTAQHGAGQPCRRDPESPTQATRGCPMGPAARLEVSAGSPS
jgi:hypothetical protein